jgi:hypothetical protein
MGLHLAILAESVLLYLTALVFLTYLGTGFSAILLPGQLSHFRWLLAPYLGYSALVVVSGLLVSFGASVGTALVVVGLMSTAGLSWAVTRGAVQMRIPMLRWWLLVPAMGLPLYGITAASMANNGTMAYVGPNFDPFLLIPLAEWLKGHGAPMFSIGIPPSLDPHWNASIPPYSSWLAQDAHLDHFSIFGNDVYFPFFRGPVYLASSLGLILGWDCYKVLRPELAFLLSLSLPVVYIFSRQIIRTSARTSALAALLTGLNGTTFFWVSLGHPGEAATMFMAPLVYLVTLSAVEDGGKLPSLGAALVLAADVVSYYQGQPVVLALLAAGLLFLASRKRQWSVVVIRSMAIGLGALLLTFPDQIRLLLDWRNGALIQLPGWGNPVFPPISDALGATLDASAFRLVAGAGQLGQGVSALLGGANALSTALALFFALLGVAIGSAGRLGLCRSMLLGGLASLAYFRFVSAFPYAVVKGQSIIAFMLSICVAIGIAVAGRWAACRSARRGGLMDLQPGSKVVAVAVALLVLLASAATNLGMGAYAFWKPVGNMWDTRLWEAEQLAQLLPRGATVRLSSNIWADPEVIDMTLYLLRNQVPTGPFSLAASRVAHEVQDGDAKPPEFAVLGSNEVAAASGYLEADAVWGGTLLRAFRAPPRVSGLVTRIEADGEDADTLPSRLPVTVDVSARPTPLAGDAAPVPMEGYLLFGLAAEQPSTLVAVVNGEPRSLGITKGVSVRSIPIKLPARVSLFTAHGSPASLLFCTVRPDGEDPNVSLDYPEVLSAFGDSTFQDGLFTTRFTYLDVKVPASHSLDLFDVSGQEHLGWFELPTNPDERLREVRFDLNPTSLEHEASVNGQRVELPFSVQPLPDGEYTAYFTLSRTGAQPVRIPLYRYRLEGGRAFPTDIYPLQCAWDGKYDFGRSK